jgi:hypothetical protein
MERGLAPLVKVLLAQVGTRALFQPVANNKV